MARGTRTVYLGKRNKELSSTFQPPEEGWSVQRPKRWNKHGGKDEDNSPKNVDKRFIRIPTSESSVIYRGSITAIRLATSVRATEYTDCISAEG